MNPSFQKGNHYFVLHPLLRTEFPREESWKSFVFGATARPRDTRILVQVKNRAAQNRAS